jgi:ABC-type sugar transport system permease subunit
VNANQRARRNERLRRVLLRTFVWVVLVVFILTSVGVALVNFAGH